MEGCGQLSSRGRNFHSSGRAEEAEVTCGPKSRSRLRGNRLHLAISLQCETKVPHGHPVRILECLSAPVPQLPSASNQNGTNCKDSARTQDQWSIWTTALAPSPGIAAEQAAFPSCSKPGPLAMCVGRGEGPRAGLEPQLAQIEDSGISCGTAYS